MGKTKRKIAEMAKPKRTVSIEEFMVIKYQIAYKRCLYILPIVTILLTALVYFKDHDDGWWLDVITFVVGIISTVVALVFLRRKLKHYRNILNETSGK